MKELADCSFSRRRLQERPETGILAVPQKAILLKSPPNFKGSNGLSCLRLHYFIQVRGYQSKHVMIGSFKVVTAFCVGVQKVFLLVIFPLIFRRRARTLSAH